MTALDMQRIVFRDPIYLGTTAELVLPRLHRLPVVSVRWLADTPRVVLMGRNGRPRTAVTLPGHNAGVKPKNTGKTFPPEPLSNDEALALLASIPQWTKTGRPDPVGVRNRALLTLLWRTGLRISEALDLRPHHIDFPGRCVTVLHGKGDKRRTVGIDLGALAEVQRWLFERATLEGLPVMAPLFCTVQLPGRGGRINSAYVRTVLHKYGRLAGIAKRVHPHGLRHSLAVSMIRDDFPLAHVSAQLGHSHLSTTDGYLRGMGVGDAFKLVGERTWPGLAA